LISMILKRMATYASRQCGYTCASAEKKDE
jgi:hypothetical protein